MLMKIIDIITLKAFAYISGNIIFPENLKPTQETAHGHKAFTFGRTNNTISVRVSFSAFPLCCCLVVSTRKINCLERLVSEMTY